MHVVGTAGHVDHGKSSLIEALTGTNPDRLPEERERGMTLDLGFAHLDFGGGLEAGIVDVPGHERFVHNMLAGAAGMDLLLLVVALDDGAMAQTFEHLEIVSLLSVPRTIVVATKCDLLEDEPRRLALGTLREVLRDTIADEGPVICVSTRTGEGMEELRAAIAATLREIPARDAAAPAYLPVDRAFVLPGVGTVVTGTLMQGSLRSGQTVRMAPAGTETRIRSLHVFGTAREVASAGSRVALNLAGIDRTEVARGDVITDAVFEPRASFDVSFTPATGAIAILKRRTPVRAYIGAAEILGTLVFDALPDGVDAVPAQLHLRHATLAFPGTRFVVRGLSPKRLLGGGELVAHAVQPDAPEVDDAFAGAVRSALHARGIEPQTLAEVAFAANLREDVVRTAMDASIARGDAMQIGRPEAYVDGDAARSLLRQIEDMLEARQLAEPWAMGATGLALARELRRDEATLARLLTAYCDDGRIVSRGGYYATTGFAVRLTDAQSAYFDGIAVGDSSHPFAPAVWSEVLDGVRKASLEGLARAFDTAIARGAFVKVGENLYRGGQIAMIRARLEAAFAAEPRMTMAAFRDLIGTSRKYAVPLLEWFDAHGITVRVGDDRVLRGTGGNRPDA
ncbi:MAG: selenocysteine-specific translation elongation factor [Candidatus Eremiobacteraeota bacterium]|nr:selenocysteine-specific translation elongation factor [Candidatus Eremiobacteraeota bacterium]